MGTKGMECNVCGRMWTAVCPDGAKEIKCPDCGTPVSVKEPSEDRAESR